ncbi:MAG: DEAD/DEAH box helicase [Bacteroidetes bacterium]|nr:DEAD/DEAH box helicase [Bacteroidota bacterium]
MHSNNAALVQTILQKLQFTALNPMQQAALQVPLQQDVILLSATGSGKTLAYLLPVLQLLDPDKRTVQALIIIPSRELAIQIDGVFRKMQTGYKVTLCYGGHKREIEENNLVETPALIIGTPGRIADHIRRGNFNPETISTLVLDEFDKSLELGFLEEMEYILNTLKNINKRILTSATETVSIPEFVQLNNPERLNYLDPEGSTNAGLLEVKTVLSEDKDKLPTLLQLLCYVGARPTIIFCNHRDAVERTSNWLAENGIPNVFYHGGMEQQERDAALCKFKNGTSNFLVTTDLAARGLDIPYIRNIIHYHLPAGEDAFTHRNGRTARMDASGTAYVLWSAAEQLPEYITAVAQPLTIEGNYPIPEKTKWSTLFIAAGKKDKVNKVDIVGFLSHKGLLKKEDIGLIDVKDFFSFVAIRKTKMSETINKVKDEKIKNKKVKIAIAK